MTAAAGYSGTPLAKKLGIGPGARVKTASAPDGYLVWLAPLPAGVRVSPRLRAPVDIWHAFVRRRRLLGPALDRALRELPDDGAIWISWPKKSAGLAGDLGEDDVRRAALQRGLVDVKVCAVDATWSGLKLVLRRERRGAECELAIREPGAADRPALLRLNRAAEVETGPLDDAALERLLADCDLRLLAVDGDRVAGFLLALGAGRGYASPNYRWFAERYPRFLYVDRVIVDPAARGRGIAWRLYRALFDFARRHAIADILAEINIEPPNPASLTLHRKLGFAEVGQLVHGAGKRVSMQRLELI